MKARERRKACAKCGCIVGEKVKQCPVCGSTEFVNKWKGEVIIFSEESEMAKVIGAKPGNYALRLIK